MALFMMAVFMPLYLIIWLIALLALTACETYLSAKAFGIKKDALSSGGSLFASIAVPAWGISAGGAAASTAVMFLLSFVVPIFSDINSEQRESRIETWYYTLLFLAVWVLLYAAFLLIAKKTYARRISDGKQAKRMFAAYAGSSAALLLICGTVMAFAI